MVSALAPEAPKESSRSPTNPRKGKENILDLGAGTAGRGTATTCGCMGQTRKRERNGARGKNTEFALLSFASEIE